MRQTDRTLLEHKLCFLEEVQRRSVGGSAPLACRECLTVEPEVAGAAVEDNDQRCLYGTHEWSALSAVIIEVQLVLETQHEKEKLDVVESNLSGEAA